MAVDLSKYGLAPSASNSWASQYSWVGNTLQRRMPTGYGSAGQVLFGAPTTYATRDKSGMVTFGGTPSTSKLASFGLGDNSVFKVGDQYYQSRGGKLYATDAQGRTLTEAYQSSYDEAKAANEQRYQDILKGYEQQGQQAVADVNSAYDAAESRGAQDLVSSGLAGTTVLPSMRAGIAKQKTAAVGRLKESLLADRLGFMERRTDQYPDYSQLLQLAMLQGRGNGLSAY